MARQSFRAIVLGTVLAVSTAMAIAGTLPVPEGRGILQIDGKVANVNVEQKALFDQGMLEKLGIHRVQTTTPWTEGKQAFEGVLLRDLLKQVGAEGATVVAVALNDYKVEIPMDDFVKYPVILAYRMNGEVLKVREKGPLWIVYPQDDFPELNTKATHSKWVWQVKGLAVR